VNWSFWSILGHCLSLYMSTRADLKLGSLLELIGIY